MVQRWIPLLIVGVLLSVATWSTWLIQARRDAEWRGRCYLALAQLDHAPDNLDGLNQVLDALPTLIACVKRGTLPVSVMPQ